MRRFYFHLTDTSGRTEDCEGSLLPDAQAATAKAVHHAREMMAQEIRESGTVRMDRVIEIVADNGGLVRRMAFGDAVSLKV